jgi:adenylate kinase
MRLYLIIGAPGAGKGTQAAILATRTGLPHIASGDLFRAAARDKTKLGRDVAGYMERGALVPDDLAIRFVLARLSQPDAVDGAILDGFPRTRQQAEALDAALAKRGAAVRAALYIGVSEKELLRRLSGRWICRAEGHTYHALERPPAHPGECDIDGSELYQRDDDKPATVRQRLERQLPPMYEVIDHYTERGVLTAVDGEGPIEAVTEALMRGISQPAK